jgi:hypothetical protein
MGWRPLQALWSRAAVYFAKIGKWLKCVQTRCAASKATGIPESTLILFVVGVNVLRGEGIDKLVDYLGLALTAKAGKARKDR